MSVVCWFRVFRALFYIERGPEDTEPTDYFVAEEFNGVGDKRCRKYHSTSCRHLWRPF
jgi:hypothetical protein